MSGSDNTNSVLALAFGFVIGFGTIRVMYDLDHNMIRAPDLVRMRR